jgi:hypothetical protein
MGWPVKALLGRPMEAEANEVNRSRPGDAESGWSCLGTGADSGSGVTRGRAAAIGVARGGTGAT